MRYYIYFLCLWGPIQISLFVGHAVEAFQAGLIVVYDEGNESPSKAMNYALDKVLKPKGITVDPKLITEIAVKGRVPQSVLNSLCSALTDIIAKKQSPIIIDITLEGVPSETVKYFAYAMAIPAVSVSFAEAGESKAWHRLNIPEIKYLIHIMPPTDVLAEVLPATVNAYQLKDIAVLYDEHFTPHTKMDSVLLNSSVRNILKSTSGDVRVKDLDEILFYKNYFVLSSVERGTEVFMSAVKQRLLPKAGLTWYFASLETTDMEFENDAEIYVFKPKVTEEENKLLKKIRREDDLKYGEIIEHVFFIDVFVRTILAVDALEKNNLWPLPNTFMTCDEFPGNGPIVRVGPDLRSAMRDVDVTPTYAPLQIAGNEQNGKSYMKFNMELFSVKFSKSGSEISTLLGTWEAGYNTSIQTVSGTNFPATAAFKPKYRIVTNVQPPFIMVRDKGRSKEYYGYCMELLESIKTIVGDFDYDIYEVPDGKMGYIDDYGDWSGIVKELIEKNADIGLASISIMPERQRAIDFTMPYYDLVGISILMQKPEPITSLFKFLTVLETDVWLCILAAYFLTSILMWIFDRWSPYSYQNNKEKYKDDEEKRIFNLKECLWFCMTSLTPQGGGEAPKNLSGRLVAATWWLFGFIIMASYTANLAAFLTVSRLDTPIESLDDLSKQYKIQYAPIKGSAEMIYFERMAGIENQFYEIWKDMSLNDSLTALERSKLAVWDYPVSDKFTKMWQAMNETGFPESLEDAVAKIRVSKSTNDGFALLGDATDNRYLHYQYCDLQVVGTEFSRKPYAIALQKNSPLKQSFDAAIQKLINDGALTKMDTKWWKSVNRRGGCIELNEEENGISIKNIGGVFIVIVIGIIGAVFTLTLEFSVYEYQRKKDLKKFGGAKEGWKGNDSGPSQPSRGAALGFNRFLDPLNLYGDHFTRRTNIGRSVTNYPW